MGGALRRGAVGGNACAIVIISAAEEEGDASERGSKPIGHGIQLLTSSHALPFGWSWLRCDGLSAVSMHDETAFAVEASAHA